MSTHHCTCTPIFEDPILLERLRERTLELEELTLDYQQAVGNVERENQFYVERIRIEQLAYQESEQAIQTLNDQVRNYKQLMYKKQQELQQCTQKLHEAQADKRMLQNDVDFLRQQLLHGNEGRNQLVKKEEHIKLLQEQTRELEEQIYQSKRELATTKSRVCCNSYK